jgi:hypothetical protein
MNLKHTKKVIFEVDYFDFEKFVNEVYQTDFDFVAQHEANNYSQYSFKPEIIKNLDENKILEKDKKQKMENIRQGIITQYTSVHDIFDTLLTDGIIEEGEYVITVSW